jgi:hypothetical protein
MSGQDLKIVREIEEKYEEKYGKIQACCNLYKNYCRCSKETQQQVSDRTTE